MAAQPAFWKRLNLYMRKLVGHGWQAIGFFVLSLYGLFTTFASDMAQRRFLMAIYVDPQHKVAVWLAVVCVFLLYAGFQAWDEEYLRAEKNSESKISKELRRFQEREWPRLTNVQKTKIIARLEKIGRHTIWIIRPNNHDCVALALDFDEAFRKADWDVPHDQPYSTGEEKLGITLYCPIESVESAVNAAIVETTDLPASIYFGDDRERKYRSENVLVLSIGLKAAT